jgi:hypothetical protein
MLTELPTCGTCDIPDQQLNEAVNDPDVLAEVVQQLKSYGLKNGLKPFEIPAK